MKTMTGEKPAWLAAGLRVTFLTVMILLLLPALAPGQFAWPSMGGQTFLPGKFEIGPGNFSSPVLRPTAPGRGNPGRHPAPNQVVSLPAARFQQKLAVLPAASVWRPAACPLPPASAFPLQLNLRKYLETWPTPGFTTTEAWSEYEPEDGEDVD